MVREELGLAGVAAAAFPTKGQAVVSQSKSGAEGCRQSSRHPVLISVLFRLQLVHCNLVNICGCDLQQDPICIKRTAAAGADIHSCD